MTPRFAVIGLVASDMAATLAFYRRLGLVFPEGSEDQPHVEAELPGGSRLAIDTEETVRSFHAGWRPPADGGGRMSLAFGCDGPAEVDSVYEDLAAPDTTASSSRGTPSGGCGTRSCTTRTAMASTCSRRYPRPSSSPSGMPANSLTSRARWAWSAKPERAAVSAKGTPARASASARCRRRTRARVLGP